MSKCIMCEVHEWKCRSPLLEYVPGKYMQSWNCFRVGEKVIVDGASRNNLRKGIVTNVYQMFIEVDGKYVPSYLVRRCK